ncbi:hypothetical protein GPECTOR_16g648 [Gonium pectorale]|uniref:Uncharacterized protein n=1 Tax=Gonium pectorale TaxID=33097 RepID=A0A150GL03_GONPE|nr:hypothetical protein GPECTOR_16g648 [Gonium pectorale]|eukprot:KXZ50474.1 hypothetical protein GPECTOR_16g648 [Gonium pectorale]
MKPAKAQVQASVTRLEAWRALRATWTFLRKPPPSHTGSDGALPRGGQRQRTCRCTATKQQELGALPLVDGSPQRPSSAAGDKARPGRSTAPSSSGGPGGPEEEPSTSSSFQIGLDPFTQQLILSALTVGGAAGIAAWAHVDLGNALRLDPDALGFALQLSSPVLLLLLAVVAPRWAPPFKGSELERLRHNYYMTAQVVQLYTDPDDDDDGDGSGSGSDGGGGERARVQRRLRLEQTVGWGTLSSGLALMQAFTLQPWNPPTANYVFGLGLAGRSVQQLANEFLVRGAGWGLISGWVVGALSAADASDGILFYGKVFGGPDAIKYAAGLALVAMGLPGALWEARAARNFVRASVVGPVRDAAIFCTGNGVDEPAYCDPAGFAMMAARRPANAAPVADVVTRTRGWRSGPASSYSSVSSLSSVDLADLAGNQLPGGRPPAAQSATSGVTAAQPSSSSSSSSAAQPAHDAPQQHEQQQQPASAARDGGGSAGNSAGGDAVGDGGGAGGGGQAPLRVGPVLSQSSAAFEWDSEDMGVLLRVETLQDKIAFWSALYYQLLVAFAINGSFLASDCNLLASFAAAWLLRTGPLLLAELRARAAADAALRAGA